MQISQYISFDHQSILFNDLSTWDFNIKDVLDCKEALLPNTDLFLDLDPLILVNLPDCGSFDEDFIVELVNFGIDDPVAHSLDDPFLNIVLIDIEQLSNLLEGHFSLLIRVTLNATNLNVLLLQNSFFCADLFLFKKLALFCNFRLKLLNVFL